MGEKSKLPDQHMKNEETQAPTNIGMEEDDEEESESEQLTDEEYKALDNQLNALNEALDRVEQKNADIFAQLHQLLEANRQVRNQMEQEPSN